MSVDYASSTTPVIVSDATSMMKTPISRNERPYTLVIKKRNNAMVDEWGKVVLKNICKSDGTVPAGLVYRSWQLFLEGKTIQKFAELRSKGIISIPEEDVIKYWKDFFEKDIEEIHSYGSGIVSEGWSVVTRYMKGWYADRKWKEFFSKSGDPLWWEKNHARYSSVLNPTDDVLWDKETFQDIREKVSTVLMTQVQPQGI